MLEEIDVKKIFCLCFLMACERR